MKLLFIQDALVNAGAERSHLEILSRFSDKIDVSLVYFYPKHELKEAYEKAGVRLIFLDIPESYHFPMAVSRLVKLIKDEKPDLLISSLWRADIISRMASLITGVSLVGTLVNDSYSTIAWKDKKGLKYRMVYWLDRLTSGIPKHWIANAQALAESHLKTLGLESKKISVVYRGRCIPETYWSEDKLREIGLRRDTPSARYPKDQNSNTPVNHLETLPQFVSSPTARGFNFISYGRLLERKGFQDAIQAFSIVLQKYPKCTLTIFGEGPYRSELEKLIQDLGMEESVFLPGKILNPIEALVSGYRPLKTDHCPLITAYCFLFPSWYEGFSGALIEAMMSGIPIISSNIPMNLEAVSPENALIFEVQNRDHLANQMLFAIEHPELMAELGQKARKEAVASFDVERIAKEYEGVLKNYLSSIRPKIH